MSVLRLGREAPARLALAAVLVALPFDAPEATAARPDVCGTLDDLIWPNGLNGTPGVAVIGGRAFLLDVVPWSAGTATITRAGASVGSPVCLTGGVEAGRHLISAYRLDACAAGCATRAAGATAFLAGTAGALAVPMLGLVVLAAAGLRGRRPRRAPRPSREVQPATLRALARRLDRAA